MQTQDHEVLRHLMEWCSEGIQPWLCTIVHTVGSSPRPAGSMMACVEDGRQAGSVSGGCVEEDLLERIRAGEFNTSAPQVIEYGVTAQENERLGLPCGGRVHLLLQKLGHADLPWLEDCLARLENRQYMQRCVQLDSGETRIEPASHFLPLKLDDTSLQHSLGPRMRMLLVGAGQLAQSLSELALAMDYEVLVTDPRQEALNQWEGPLLPLLQGMPDDIVRAHANGEFSIVITLTHDPRIDDMALMEALESAAWYVGALGSVRTTEKRVERLGKLGLTSQQLEKLHAPVGLPIGSKTPIEIAVAIMAQLTQLRRDLG